MNENLNLVEILKDCPEGTKFYSTIHGEVEFNKIEEESHYPIIFTSTVSDFDTTTADRKYYEWGGECILFPSKEQRDWSKFTAPWLKKERFDPKTLKPFDKVLAKNSDVDNWRCTLYSHKKEDATSVYKCTTADYTYRCCIPYNEDTKHLLGTSEEAPEYYRYWEE